MADPDLLIVGGSVRAAAWCAVRAGLKVAALDRYNDLDLLAVAEPCFLWDGSDEQVERVVGELSVPWMYTGPLENRPDLVDRCAQLAPLRGNPGDVLRAVRDPVRVQRALAGAGFPTLPVREEADPPPADGTWLLKPRAGGGGRGIVVWNDRAANHPTLAEPHYYQELELGLRSRSYHLSSAFEAAPGGVRLSGIFHWDNWVADDPAPAWTRGAYGPESVPRRNGYPYGIFPGEWEERLASEFHLRGPCGVDFTQGWRNGHCTTVVEMNPRFTSSMELCDLHCGPFGGSDCRDQHVLDERAKRAVCADRPSRVGRLPVFGPFDSGWIADVPAPGSVTPAGAPICTVFASEPRPALGAADPDSSERVARLRAQLDRREAEVRAALEPA